MANRLSHTTVTRPDQMPDYGTPYSIMMGKRLNDSSIKASKKKSDASNAKSSPQSPQPYPWEQEGGESPLLVRHRLDKKKAEQGLTPEETSLMEAAKRNFFTDLPSDDLLSNL